MGGSMTNDKCNATELLLRFGRGTAPTGREPVPLERRPPEVTSYHDERVEIGLRQAGHRLQSAMSTLARYRESDDEVLRSAYTDVHDALTDLAATYTWVTLGRRPARPAPPARRRRPWGG